MTLKALIKKGGSYGDSSMEFFRFPGGEYDIKPGEAEHEDHMGVFVTSASPDELIKAGLYANLMKKLQKRAVLLLPYAPAARADRGVPCGAEVYAGIINSFGFDEVRVFDPHSPVIMELINNSIAVDSTALIVETVAQEGYVGVIAPDKGAVARAGAVAQGLQVPLYIADKKRDFETGKLLEYSITGLPENGKLLVVDDICDGGGTFLLLAQASELPQERLNLWISHGIFSGRAPLLNTKFEKIFTTDSFEGIHAGAMELHTVPVLPALLK